MKNISFKLLLIGLVIFNICFSSCSDDKDPFGGVDNYIVEFSLTKNDIIYQGKITENQLIIEIPKSIDLTGAKVQYTLSELATISPDPTSITDWNTEQTFTVSSYVSTTRAYTYLVKKTEGNTSKSVTLLTQSDVDRFVVGNIESIEGDLILGSNVATQEEDQIKNIEGLKTLIKISNNLYINSNVAVANLNGFENLESAGNIYISMDQSEELTEVEVKFPKLAKTGELNIKGSRINVIDLPLLQSTYILTIDCKNITTITLPLLQKVFTDFTIQSGTNASTSTANSLLLKLSLEKLTSVGSFNLIGLLSLEDLETPVLENIDGTFNLQYNNSIAILDIPNIAIIGGKLNLQNTNAIEKLSMPKLTLMGDFLYSPSYNQQKLNSIDFSSLKEISKDFKIERSLLTSINLPVLQNLKGQLYITDSPLVENINFPVLSECNNIYLYGLSLIESLDLSKAKNIERVTLITCSNLSEIKGNSNIENITLNGGSQFADIPNFVNLENISGTLEITNYSQNDNFAIKGIKHLGTYIQSSGKANSIINLPDLETIDNLKCGSYFLKKFIAPNLLTVTNWDTSFWSNVESGDIEIPKLKKIGTFKFHGSTYAGAANTMKLTNLNDFAGVTQIDKVELKWWGNMTDFSGLKLIFPNLKKENWSVDGCAYNPTYEQMIDGEYSSL